MKAIVFSDIGKFEVAERPMPRITETDQLLVKVEASSICGSDVQVLADPPRQSANIGTILGHEFVGRIVKIGDGVKNFDIGNRIVCDPNIPCNHCHPCQTGYYNLCKNMVTIGIHVDGGFAEYVLVPEKVALKISDSLPTDLAVLAEPMNCIMGSMNQIRLLPGETVAVLGAGPIGLFFTSLVKANGAGKVLVSEISDFRISYAKKMEADIIINPNNEDLKQRIMQETNGNGADVIIDTVGTLLPDCIECVRPGGKILLFGMNEAAKQTICQTDIVWSGITIIGNFIGRFTLEPTIKFLESKLVDFDRLITHRITLDEFGEGLKAVKQGSAVEVIIYPGGERVG